MANNLQALTQRVGRNVRRIVTALLVAGWTAGWGMVTLVGWAASSSSIFYAGVSMMAAGLLGYGTSYAVGRRRLSARAETSLIARAELEQLTISDSMAARLHLFDDAMLQLQPALNDPSLPHADQSVELLAKVSSAQDELFTLARRHATLLQELQNLALYSSSDLLEQSRGDKQAELTRVEEDAEALVRETRKLATTAEQVRTIASSRATEATERLKDAVSQFDLTLSAYREVDALAGDGEAAKRRRLQAESQRN